MATTVRAIGSGKRAGSSSTRREDIKATAMRVFVESGMDVGLREVAASCGMSAPNIYAHFTSKTALVEELFKEGYAAYAEAVREAAASGGAFAEQLGRVVDTVCRLHDRDPVRFRFLLISQHGVLSSVERDSTDNPVHLLSSLVSTAMERGEIPRGDPELATAMIMGLLLEPATFLLHGRIEGGMENMSHALVRACLCVVGAQDINTHRLS